MISPCLVYDPTAEQVARALLGADAYLINTHGWPAAAFTWKSGIKAPVYTDCRRLNAAPGAVAIVAKALGSSIRANFPEVELVVGIAEAGIVWSTLAAFELGLPHAFVRKSTKEHGVCPGLVEGSPINNSKAVVVDDLVASGESVIKAIVALREERAIETIGVQSIVNWDFVHMRDSFRAISTPVRTLVSYPQILKTAVIDGRMTHEAADQLADFYRNPKHHVWNNSALSAAPFAAESC